MRKGQTVSYRKTMIEPVDLEALDASHEAAAPGMWIVHAIGRLLHVVAEQPTGRAGVALVDDVDNARSIIAKHDAYRAMAAEIRALRAVRDAAAEVSAYHGVHGTETIQDVNVDALREALAKVPATVDREVPR